MALDSRVGQAGVFVAGCIVGWLLIVRLISLMGTASPLTGSTRTPLSTLGSTNAAESTAQIAEEPNSRNTGIKTAEFHTADRVEAPTHRDKTAVPVDRARLIIKSVADGIVWVRAPSADDQATSTAARVVARAEIQFTRAARSESTTAAARVVAARAARSESNTAAASAGVDQSSSETERVKRLTTTYGISCTNYLPGHTEAEVQKQYTGLMNEFVHVYDRNAENVIKNHPVEPYVSPCASGLQLLKIDTIPVPYSVCCREAMTHSFRI